MPERWTFHKTDERKQQFEYIRQFLTENSMVNIQDKDVLDFALKRAVEYLEQNTGSPVKSKKGGK
jgi:hypothetical protein